MLFRGGTTMRALACAGVCLWVLCVMPQTFQATAMLAGLDGFLDDAGLPAADVATRAPAE